MAEFSANRSSCLRTEVFPASFSGPHPQNWLPGQAATPTGRGPVFWSRDAGPWPCSQEISALRAFAILVILSREKLFPEDVVPTESSIAKARSTLLSSQSRWRKEGSQPRVSVIWTISPFDSRFLSERLALTSTWFSPGNNFPASIKGSKDGRPYSVGSGGSQWNPCKYTGDTLVTSDQTEHKSLRGRGHTRNSTVYTESMSEWCLSQAPAYFSKIKRKASLIPLQEVFREPDKRKSKLMDKQLSRRADKYRAVHAAKPLTTFSRGEEEHRWQDREALFTGNRTYLNLDLWIK